MTSLVQIDNPSPAWHHERSLGVGGSEAASLFNAGYGCARRLVYEKRGVPADYQHTAATERLFRRGHIGEQIVVDMFTEDTGLKVRKQPSKVSRTHPHARCNIDRQIIAVDPAHLLSLTMDASGNSPIAPIALDLGPGALEAKTMNTFDFARIKKEGIVNHDHYLLQLQQNLAVTQYKWGVLVIGDLNALDILWFVVVRNDMLCAEILNRTETLWTLVVDTSAPLPARLPDGDKRCRTCLHRRTCRGEQYLVEHAGADFSTDYVETADPEMVELANDFVAANEQAAEAGAVLKAIKTRIQNRMTADKVSKILVPNISKFCLSTSKGSRSYDAKALDGEVNCLTKGTMPLDMLQALRTATTLTLEQLDTCLRTLLPLIGQRIDSCKKTGAPVTTLRPYDA